MIFGSIMWSMGFENGINFLEQLQPETLPASQSLELFNYSAEPKVYMLGGPPLANEDLAWDPLL